MRDINMITQVLMQELALTKIKTELALQNIINEDSDIDNKIAKINSQLYKLIDIDNKIAKWQSLMTQPQSEE